ncbi:MAG TPA: hypothetical protein VK711_09220 [Puia sp.]|nr:hypothetical protein [Puia sp.]
MSSRQISIKKPSALVFMALMIFISGVKLFHSHHDSYNSSSHSSARSLTVNSDFSLHRISQDKHCPICDFNLMKDADMAYSDIPLFIRVSGNAVFTSLLSQSLPQYSFPGRGRSPPVFLS